MGLAVGGYTPRQITVPYLAKADLSAAKQKPDVPAAGIDATVMPCTILIFALPDRAGFLRPIYATTAQAGHCYFRINRPLVPVNRPLSCYFDFCFS